MSDRELWAEALRLESTLGDFTPIWVAERIAHLKSIGDSAGVDHFSAVAQLVAELLQTSGAMLS